jgi:hypothetical protein
MGSVPLRSEQTALSYKGNDISVSRRQIDARRLFADEVKTGGAQITQNMKVPSIIEMAPYGSEQKKIRFFSEFCNNKKCKK